MGYLHIENLYKNQTILLFKECYALEKIHGTSAHVGWKDETLYFFSGGAAAGEFSKLFNEENLTAKFIAAGKSEIVVYGEAYGGKMQGMSKTYGADLRFVVFDVKIGESWLNVPNAEAFAISFGLEFVPYAKIPTSLITIDAERDKPSGQSIRNLGVLEGVNKIREGVVLRPLEEMTDKRGNRVICKHKRAEFSETKTPHQVDPARKEVFDKAEAIAEEWVTEMRLSHVLDKIGNPRDMEAIPELIQAMIEDVTREAAGEILDSKEARKAIGQKAVQLFKTRIMQIRLP